MEQPNLLDVKNSVIGQAQRNNYYSKLIACFLGLQYTARKTRHVLIMNLIGADSFILFMQMCVCVYQ